MEWQPDFIIIGAMKSATTTLHEQLARQDGVFMSRPKEPNFFSDDEIYARGLAWYAGLFRDAGRDDLRGESSTHYTKLPTYPRAVERMAAVLPDVRLIYVMRHPIDRLMSHYVHAGTVGRIAPGTPMEQAIEQVPELIHYGCYARQLTPYFEAFGKDRVLPVFFGRLARRPQAELSRIGRFLGRSSWRWDETLGPRNVGRERLRLGPFALSLLQSPGITAIRRRVVPRPFSERIKRALRTDLTPPSLSAAVEDQLRGVFDEDLARLGEWLGASLDCGHFDEATTERVLDWRERT